MGGADAKQKRGRRVGSRPNPTDYVIGSCRKSGAKSLMDTGVTKAPAQSRDRNKLAQNTMQRLGNGGTVSANFKDIYIFPLLDILLTDVPLPLTVASNPTRAFACAANHIYFLCSLGNHSAASLLARDDGACAVQLGIVAEKGELPTTPSIYTIDAWSGRVREAKYKRRHAKNNGRGCKM